MVNPDGIVAGNYRCTTQGKDPNRFFFADDDPEGKHRIIEVELVRAFMEQHFNPKDINKRSKLSMFLDIHAHSGQRDIFVYAPNVPNSADQENIKMFPAILDEISPYFNYDGCKFGNEKYKKNCARLGVYRDYALHNTYTIESSCWGYTDPDTDATMQFKELDFMKFGKHLAEGIAKHLHLDINEQDKQAMCSGLDI